MRKRNKTGERSPALKRVLSEAEIEALLENIEQAMLKGDQKRLEALLGQFPQGHVLMPEVITRRIVEGRAQIPLLSLEMLGIFAGRRTPDYLKRIAGDKSAADIFRFGARRLLGWPERGEAKSRLAFLGGLRNAEATLIEAMNEAAMMWPGTIDSLEEVLGYVKAMPSKRRQVLVTRAAAELELRAAWLLQAAIHIRDQTFQQAALDELVKLRPAGARAEIGRLAKTAVTERIRREAAAAFQRLGLRAVGQTKEKEEPLTLPPVDRVLMSEVDNDGGQVVIVIRRWDEGLHLFADVFHNDHWGIKSVFGAARVIGDELEEMVADLGKEGIGLIKVDLAAARGALAAALEVNAATGHALPPEYALWEPLLHDTYPPPEREPMAVPELDDAPYAGRQDLLGASGQLANHDLFDSWPFDPYTTWLAMAKMEPPSGGVLKDKHYRTLIERLVDRETAAVLRRRLRRQAWLLERSGDPKARDLALAVAAQLATGRSDELAKQPFLRTIVQRSVDRAIVTAMKAGDGDGA